MQIYKLIDPRDDSIRYIGQTRRPAQRLRDHINSSARYVGPFGEWLRELKADNLKPIMKRIKFVERDWYPQSEERVEIEKHLKLGHPLLNTDKSTLFFLEHLGLSAKRQTVV
jgi:hypothetical protein